MADDNSTRNPFLVDEPGAPTGGAQPNVYQSVPQQQDYTDPNHQALMQLVQKQAQISQQRQGLQNISPPNLADQSQHKPGVVKQFLMSYLDQVGRNLTGRPSAYNEWLQQQKLGQAQQGINVQQENADTNKGYKDLQGQNVQAGMPRPITQDEADQLNSQFGGTNYKAGQVMHPAAIEALGKVALQNKGKVDVQQMRSDVQDRHNKAMMEFQQAIRDRNYDLAERKFQESEKFRNAMLGLANNRLDMAREALDYREDGPTAMTKTRGQFAASLIPHAAELTDEIDRLASQGKLGPIAGRWNDFLAGKVGEGDPEYTKLRTIGSLYSTGMMQTHFGGRSGQYASEYFNNLLNKAGQDPAQWKAAINATLPYLGGYKEAAQFKKNSPTPKKGDPLGILP